MPEEFCRWARGVVLALAVAGPAAPALAADKVVLQLRWDHQFQFAGYYAAQWQGFYRDAGLEVEIRSAVGPDRKAVKAIEEVMAGRADFDIGAADVLVARDRGSPLLILASIFQRS
ncbi:MAG: ABC transporter substrate-binding protein, partial [Alphaproteobacteria bacterium]|nr:ABC transporter substrate-binding protein [Alphaproteobacteria bacterium]